MEVNLGYVFAADRHSHEMLRQYYDVGVVKKF